MKKDLRQRLAAFSPKFASASTEVQNSVIVGLLKKMKKK
jgi:hypothetical protein